MRTPVRSALSHAAGWVADRRIPKPLRSTVYRAYARFTGADLAEVRDPLAEHASLADFFVRRLKDGARPIASAREELSSPCDGTVQSIGPIEAGSVLQAKGRNYSIAGLLADEAAAARCDGGQAWTIYLSPRDYHRVHVPEASSLESIRRVPGSRYSVAPAVLDKRLVLPVNERAVFELRSSHGTYWLVMVGALNVGRIRIEGERGEGAGAIPRSFARGEELARFEMGSTVVLLTARGAARPLPGLAPGSPVRLGAPIGTWLVPH
jgi:phosphatidylserine decarboxylase